MSIWYIVYYPGLNISNGANGVVSYYKSHDNPLE